MDVTRWAIESFLRFVLVTARVSGLFLLAPVLGSAGVPDRLKVGLAAVLALVILPVLPTTGQAVAVGELALRTYVAAALGELAVGLIIGLVVAIVLAGFEMAGLFVGQQTGLAFANVINPLTDEQVSVTGRFYGFLVLVVFLAIGGHRMLVGAMCRSFQAVPLAGFRFGAEAFGAVLGLSGQMFQIALAVSAPVVVALVLTEVALGLIARTVPQLNILVVGFPLRIGIGWIVMILSLGAVAFLSRELLLEMFDDIGDIIGLM